MFNALIVAALSSAAPPTCGEAKAIGPAQASSQTLELQAGDLVEGFVQQEGIDLVVEWTDPQGALQASIDSPNGRDGPEPVLWVAETPGAHRLAVRPLAANAPSGRYRVCLAPIRTATPRDHALAGALAAWGKGQEERSRGLEAQPGASGHYVVAERLGRSALASYERWLDPDDPRIADVLDLLGYVEDEVGEYGRGTLRFERALALRRRRGAEAGVIARTTSDLGWLRLLHGESQAAETAFREALSIAPDRTGARQGLAHALAARNELADAEREALAARQAREAELGATPPALAGDLLFLASLARRQGRLERCEELIRKAEPSIGSGHRRARLLEEKAALALARNDAGVAETSAGEARRIRATAFGPRHPAQIPALVLSVRSLLAAGRPAEATATLAEARDMASRFLAPAHPVHAELSDLEARIVEPR